MYNKVTKIYDDMKKFILLFAMAVVSLTAVKAQTITKIYGKNIQPAYSNWIDFETDTLRYESKTRLNVSLYFAVVYKNGSTALEANDIIALDFRIASTSLFNADGDTLFYKLNSPLGANDTLFIEMGDAENMQYFTNSFGQMDNFRDKVALTATVFKTSKFSIPNGTKQVANSHFLRLAEGTSPLTEKTIQNVQLFPNPVNSTLNITNLNNTKVEIFNVVGQRISTYDNATGNLNVDMTAYPNGIYFVKMQNGKSVRTEKIKLVK